MLVLGKQGVDGRFRGHDGGTGVVMRAIVFVAMVTVPVLAFAGATKFPKAEEFSTAAAAAAHCPGDVVVWSTFSKSKAFHLAASRYYGKTKHGAYVCEKDALAAGFHAAKS